MKSLKIALVCDWFLPRVGGIELHLKSLAQKLCERGHTVHLITCFPDSETGPGRGQISPGFEVIRLPLVLLPRAMVMISPGGGADRLKALMAKERYDVVHSHFSYISPFALAGVYAAKKLKIPAVITFHSFLAGFARVLKGLDRAIGWTNWPDAFTAVSRPVADEVTALSPKPVSLLPNGIDPAVWAPAGTGPVRDGVRLVSVMRLTRKKRGCALIDVFAKLGQRVAPKVELVIIGSGYMQDKMAEKINAHGIGGRVRLLGYQPPEKIRSVLSESDLFVLPCRVESFGIAALEARSLGLPVVAMAGSGVGTFIRDGQEGYLAKDDDDMVRILARLIQNPSVLSRIREHNRQVSCAFTWDRAVKDHESLYSDLICRAGG